MGRPRCLNHLAPPTKPINTGTNGTPLLSSPPIMGTEDSQITPKLKT